MIKKLLAGMVAGVLALSIVGCGSDKPAEKAGDKKETAGAEKKGAEKAPEKSEGSAKKQ